MGAGGSAGVAGITLGLSAIGWGLANVIDGFQGGNRVIPGGTLEAVDIGFGGSGSIGQLGDIMAGGRPKNVTSGLISSYSVYKSNVFQSLIQNSTNRDEYPVSENQQMMQQDNTTVIIQTLNR